MKKKKVRCPFCKKIVEAEYNETSSVNQLKKSAAQVGAAICGVGGIILLFTPAHYLGLAGLAGATALGKGANSAAIENIRHYKCPNCGKVWEGKV